MEMKKTLLTSRNKIESMKILLVNNFSYSRGGAEISLFSLGKLLKQKKHQVFYFFADKELNQNQSRFKKAFNLLYSFKAREKIGELLDKVNPDLVHLNNIYHYFSPSIIDAVKERKIPMVMTLRDYKLVCSVYKLWQKGKICQQCENKKFINILKNRCNLKGNGWESYLLWLEMNLHHKILHLYDKIDLFISPSRFLIKKFKEMGFKKKIVYLPNFLFLEQYKRDYHYGSAGKRIVYFGRLALEKGLFTLLEAVKGLNIQLKIIGQGPIEKELRKKAEKIKNVKFSSWLKGDKLKTEIKKSIFTVLPSFWYENNPRSIIESFALGRPVVASNIGGIPELVKDKVNGLLFEPGNVQDLRKKIVWMINHQQKTQAMAKNGRLLIEKNHHSEVYYQKLLKFYQSIL